MSDEYQSRKIPMPRVRVPSHGPCQYRPHHHTVLHLKYTHHIECIRHIRHDHHLQHDHYNKCKMFLTLMLIMKTIFWSQSRNNVLLLALSDGRSGSGKVNRSLSVWKNSAIAITGKYCVVGPVGEFISNRRKMQSESLTVLTALF